MYIYIYIFIYMYVYIYMIVLLCCHRPFLSSGSGNWIGASSDDTPTEQLASCSQIWKEWMLHCSKKGVAVSIATRCHQQLGRAAWAQSWTLKTVCCLGDPRARNMWKHGCTTLDSVLNLRRHFLHSIHTSCFLQVKFQCSNLLQSHTPETIWNRSGPVI